MNTFLYRLIFSKTGDVCYVGHLDFVTALRRAIRRSKLPVKYSEGFNPHMDLSVAMPLPLGMEGLREYAEVVLTERVADIKDRLGETLPPGVIVIEAAEIWSDTGGKGSGKAKSAAAQVCRAEYGVEIVVNAEDGCAVLEKIRGILGKGEISMLKKTKSGQEMADIRPDIFEVDGRFADGKLLIDMVLSAGSERNLKPELVVSYLFEGIAKVEGLNARYTRKQLILASELNNGE